MESDNNVFQVYETLPSAAKIKVNDEFVIATLKKKVKYNSEKSKNLIAAGDYIRIDYDPINGTYSIDEILPRKNKLSRQIISRNLEHVIAANIDYLFIVSSVDLPEFKPKLIDRYLITAEKFHIRPAIVINKSDLLNNENRAKIEKYLSIYKSLQYEVFFTSTKTMEGIEELRDFLKDKLSVFSGQSGVGKSTLLNTLEPNLNLRTGEVSHCHKKGKHTTTSPLMLDLFYGGKCIDTPGIKFFSLWKIEAEELKELYVEFNQYNAQCKFRNCLHNSEIDCAVKKAVESGDISFERYENYLSILEDLM